jgi:hypothetical protein
MGEPSDFDFWLGSWDVRWDGGAKTGTNEVEKVLGGKVVLEQFDGRPGIEFQGMSVSTYVEPIDRWKQTWVDSEGAYLDFVGGRVDGTMDLRMERGDQLYRMLWHDLATDSLTWNWERSDDGGGTWELLWQLSYSRRR